ncbi:MAG: FAD-binding protein [Mycobacterium sp.]
MSISHDVVVVGGGGAGLRAAIAVAEADPNLSIAIVPKVGAGFRRNAETAHLVRRR